MSKNACSICNRLEDVLEDFFEKNEIQYEVNGKIIISSAKLAEFGADKITAMLYEYRIVE